MMSLKFALLLLVRPLLSDVATCNAADFCDDGLAHDFAAAVGKDGPEESLELLQVKKVRAEEDGLWRGGRRGGRRVRVRRFRPRRRVVRRRVYRPRARRVRRVRRRVYRRPVRRVVRRPWRPRVVRRPYYPYRRPYVPWWCIARPYLCYPGYR